MDKILKQSENTSGCIVVVTPISPEDQQVISGNIFLYYSHGTFGFTVELNRNGGLFSDELEAHKMISEYFKEYPEDKTQIHMEVHRVTYKCEEEIILES